MAAVAAATAVEEDFRYPCDWDNDDDVSEEGRERETWATEQRRLMQQQYGPPPPPPPLSVAAAEMSLTFHNLLNGPYFSEDMSEVAVQAHERLTRRQKDRVARYHKSQGRECDLSGELAHRIMTALILAAEPETIAKVPW